MVVSEATVDDIRHLAEFGRRFHSEAPNYRDLPYDFVRVAAWVAMHINQDDMNVWLAKDKRGNICGILFAQLLETFFGPTLQAVETTFYVAPENRGGTTASRLLLAFVNWAKEKGAERVIVTPSSGINHAQTARFLARFGFEECATGMLLRLGK